jgi:hypothetical protein
MEPVAQRLLRMLAEGSVWLRRGEIQPVETVPDLD